MFGSNDDKKTPAEAGEKKGLFGWLRKKPQQAEPAPQESSPTQPDPVHDPVVTTPQVEPAAASQSVPESIVEPVAHSQQGHVEPGAPSPQPWLTLPVTEEPVALSDEREPHITPPIPEQSQAHAMPEPVAAQPVADIVPLSVPEPLLVQPVPEPEPEPEPVVAQAVPQPVAPVPQVVPALAPAPVQEPETGKVGFFARLKQGLSKTSASIGEGMASLFLGKKAIDDDLLEEIETRLLTADVGVEATSVIINSLTQKVARKQLTDAQALYTSLQGELAAMLKPVEQPLVIKVEHKPFVILVVGVNGAGKTTTIGKLAKKLQLEGKKVMLAAGDTFRAAAVEQLQVWGERNHIPVIAQHTGADSASVIFDAVQAAKARGIDVLIADTAGRLHTKDNLMEELKKVRRVIGKLDADAPHEVLLVLDAGTGQNAINQAKQFNQTVTLTGLALTKLDGTAKGGVIFALAKQFGLPIRYIGVGEGIDDLRTFEAEPFVQALFAERERP
ncbi:signal recognition particle-docking protein FtsY [Pseudomonas savastanoi pv. phaseolicola]|uniref:Signal recognition particle receptor FtsY n=2 Tax=Pseudomonas savastanoi pv. phaseolicola TaxID=319 RepID=Q48CL2_PSE14|nr:MULTISPECIES: signal recognition particle-docking protein FtsY [Pseudomonas]AAZ36188.1 signal recognition particle-docking protein FtsY [Pseudomonas savastanoi pv. phaseolicola 1448A]KPB46718.1 Signal recognition particle receptor FtsY [Pseudomonas savastanoi pv. phaseolicola]KPB47699.1 Signal recognition particle receptor FtsY [Pseudomonas savastanoi pv. phaseolicola]KPB53296.1 Signal recognition particle receptor FtsY [Pseudomonas savastanoi pv. phaseolicola]KPB71175.1 Signal recognition 